MKLEELYTKIGTDYSIIIERFCNNAEMLTMFVKSFPNDPTYKSMIAAVEVQNYEDIEKSAHALKGISANLGFEQLKEACSDTVLCVRQNRLEDVLLNFEKVKQEYETIIEIIQNLKNE